MICKDSECWFGQSTAPICSFHKGIVILQAIFFFNMKNISTAVLADIPDLINLLNCAYRGEASKKGWTTEANLLKGNQRMDRETLTEHMGRQDALILKYLGTENDIQGCIFLQKKNNSMYLGMLAVSPDQQAKGIGKKLLAAADEHARSMNCNALHMTVISAREELIAWYVRHGYRATGERMPFSPEEKFGIPMQPLEFIVLERKLVDKT